MNSHGSSKRHGPLRRRLRSARHWLLLHVGIHLVRPIVAVWARTLRVRWEGRECWERVCDRPVILAFWHGDMVGFAMTLPHVGGRAVARGTCMMSSPSRDGRFNAKYMWLLGCRVVLGSSSKHGAAALLGLNHALSAGLRVGLAVDGPTGPRHEAKPGAVHLSKTSGALVLPFTVTASRRWTLHDWAQTEIPRPFSTLTIRVAEPRVLDDIEAGTAWLTETLRSLSER